MTLRGHWRDEPLTPAEIDTLHLEACRLYRAGRTEQAILSWERVCEEDPGFAPAVYDLALASYRLGRCDDEAALRRVRELASRSAECAEALAWLHLECGAREEAEAAIAGLDRCSPALAAAIAAAPRERRERFRSKDTRSFSLPRASTTSCPP